jgi:hypothetical protein
MPDSLNQPLNPPLELEYVAVEALIPYARNARTHSVGQIAQLAASIREFGFTNPILTDGDNGIIAGHGRVLAARKLGLETVPTIELSHLSETQKRAYILADNKLALNAGWDDELLALELADLKVVDPDSLGLIGFSDDELAALMADPEDTDDGTYSRKIEAPIYQPTGENPPVASLLDDNKTRELVEGIRSADLPEDIAAFLEAAAQRHTVFNFARIAEFYAHADPQLQDLMEASALVIIDFDQAIEGGFVRLTKRFGDLTQEAGNAAG